MARLRKNETNVNTGGAAAAPARRQTTSAPRNRAAAKPNVSSEPEPQTDVIAASYSAVIDLSPAPEEIAALAYSYWVERGYTEGCAEQDWLRAEAELRERALATA